jgi:tetratricopeptide (TPR) repeat protein
MTVFQFALCTGQCVFLVFLLMTRSQAAEPCEAVVGRLVSVEGQVDIQRFRASVWRGAKLEDVLCQGDIVRAGKRSRAAMALINEAVLRVDQNTSVRLDNITGIKEERSLLSLIRGAFQSFSRKPHGFKVDTPYINGSIEGTEFLVRVDDHRTSFLVLEGQVVVANDQGSATAAPGEMVTASVGMPPESQTVVRPRDAVQWSLYYPPVLAVLGGDMNNVPTEVPRFLRETVEFNGRGDSGAAFAALDRVPKADRDARFYLYRASLLLSVGRVDEAQADIGESLREDPNAGLAYALSSIVSGVQNKREQARAEAERAVALSQTAAAKIALSYAQQADFQLEAARNTLQSAVEQHPADPLAWARLGELWLMLGDRRQALSAAGKATSLAPDLARTQLVRGFTALAEFRNAEAKSAFEQAITLSSADPLAHLGLGLAKISHGDLAEGRQDLEVAVALDSSNALLRAYLGKAYFEEKRYPLDAEQYSIAKSLDPLDPTSYLYAGILKQTVNRPVEAVQDLEKSIELNDNRAVYRSRLLLDKDRAARGTSLSRTYTDLGFTQLGINQATTSLGLDPSNASAHRFLSDSYRGVRRHEVARVSELLQAQLLQDANINPVQPSVAETNLNIVTLGGPATPGFNEFTPLFEQNKVQLNATAFGGNNETYGGEAVATVLKDRFSFSLGGLIYDTDGWRPNNQLEQNIYNAYAQVALTPELNVQAEFRRRDSEEGDLAFNFDPDNFLRDKTVKRDQNTARVGLRYSPAPNSNFLVSYIYNERDEKLEQSEALDPFNTLSAQLKLNAEGSQVEALYLYQRDWFNLVAGGGYSQVDRELDSSVLITNIDLGPTFSVDDETSKQDINQPRAYLYTHINAPESVTWTLGASYDDYDQDPLEETSFNPKFGVQWDVTEAFRLRAAAFKVLKPALVNNRTLEPTQVAGFNQFFDDINATQSWRYSGGFDWRLRQNLSLGGELTWRELDEPVFEEDENGKQEANLEDRRERFHNVYLYWTPLRQLGIKAEFMYDRYESEKGFSTEFENLPEQVETISLPIAVTYFNPSGFFAGVAGTFVDQEVKRSELATQGQGEDNFFLVDLALGYRLPKRHGLISLGVKNLFGEDFQYQDDSYREFRDEPSTGPYFPDRTILARIAVSF